MNRRFLLHATASLLIAATAWLLGSTDRWSMIPDGELSLACGADNNVATTSDGSCDTANNPGGITVTCAGCTPAAVQAGNNCICCDPGGVNQELMNTDSSGTSGTNPASGYQANCGNMKAATCQMINNAPACGNPMLNGLVCSTTVTQYLLQAPPD